jgi:hypothetical protein
MIESFIVVAPGVVAVFALRDSLGFAHFQPGKYIHKFKSSCGSTRFHASRAKDKVATPPLELGSHFPGLIPDSLTNAIPF